MRNERRIQSMPTPERQALAWHKLLEDARGNRAFERYIPLYRERRDALISNISIDGLVLLANRVKRRDPEFAEMLRGPEFQRRLQKLMPNKRSSFIRRAGPMVLAALVGAGAIGAWTAHKIPQVRKAAFQQGVETGKESGFREGFKAADTTRIIVDGKVYKFDSEALNELDKISRYSKADYETTIRALAQFLTHKAPRSFLAQTFNSRDSANASAAARGVGPKGLSGLDSLNTATKVLTRLQQTLNEEQQGNAAARRLWQAIVLGATNK